MIVELIISGKPLVLGGEIFTFTGGELGSRLDRLEVDASIGEVTLQEVFEYRGTLVVKLGAKIVSTGFL